jgi:hypothetical protein
MSNYTERSDLSLGPLIWEQTPSKPHINSLRRISFYVLSMGILLLGLLILCFWKRIESNDWGSFLIVEFPMIVITAGTFITAWMIRNHVHHQEQSRWLLYEQGLEAEQGDRIHSERYENLKIWQSVSTVSGYGMTETSYTYLVQFSNGYKAKTNHPQTGNLLQQMITRSQLPTVITAYQNSEQLDFADFQLNAEGVAINLHWLRRSVWFPNFLKRANIQQKAFASKYKLIPWDRISSFQVNNGRLSVMGFSPRSVEASVACSDIANLSVLLNLLEHLEYFKEEPIVSDPAGPSKIVGILYIAAGIVVAIPGNYWIYHYIQELEQSGGTIRMNFIVALMYLISGKIGIIILMLSIAIYCIYQGIREIYSQQ